MMKFSALSLALTITLTINPLQAHGGAMGVVKERMALMKTLADNTKAVSPYATGVIPNALASVEPHAAALVKAAQESLTKFPDGSHTGVTDAKERIWQERAEFDGLMTTLITHATTLGTAARAGDAAQTKAAFNEIYTTCKMCHRKYREKK